MARRLFGTDGIRGTANTEPMTPETALKVAMAVGESLHNGAHKHLVVIGKDTRLSGYMLEPALTAGFITMGMDVVLVGPLPTPAIAMLTRSLRDDTGVVISASHNPYEDDGIKVFASDGTKVNDAVEAEIEARIHQYAGSLARRPIFIITAAIFALLSLQSAMVRAEWNHAVIGLFPAIAFAGCIFMSSEQGTDGKTDQVLPIVAVALTLAAAALAVAPKAIIANFGWPALAPSESCPSHSYYFDGACLIPADFHKLSAGRDHTARGTVLDGSHARVRADSASR